METNSGVKIAMSELERIVGVLIRHLKDRHGSSVTLSKEYYWAVPSKALYDMQTAPSDFAVGQLSFDWQRLQEIGEEKDEPGGYALVWLSNLFRAIGDDYPA